MSVTREVIVATALQKLRDGGLDAISLRKIASELDIAAPTLYWHVKSKRELLDLVAEELLREAETLLRTEPEPGQPWWEWLQLRGRSLFDTLVATRDAPRVLAGNRPTPESFGHLDVTLKTLIDAGLSPGEAQQVMFTVGAYAIGSAVEWQAEADRARAEVHNGAGRKLEMEQYPHISAAFSALAHEPHRSTFEFGLQVLIDGLRARYAN